MARFELYDNRGRCVISDTLNGVTLDWLRGDFAGTVDVEVDPDAPLFRGVPATDAPEVLALERRELYDYVLANRPDLL